MPRHRRCALLTAAILWVAGDGPSAHGDPGSPPGPALSIYHAANGLLNRKLYDLAATEYRRFIDGHPDHAQVPAARYGLAVCLYRAGDYAAAVAQLTQPSPAAGDSGELAVQRDILLGRCLIQGGDGAAAAVLLQRVAQDQPQPELGGEAAVLWAEALYREQRFEEVLGVCAQARTRWPDDPRMERVSFLEALALMATADYPAAAARLEALLERYPEGRYRLPARFRLAHCRHRLGQVEPAIAGYQQVLASDDRTHHAEAMYGMAELLRQQGRLDDAADAVQRLIEQYPDAPLRAESVLLLGRVLFERRDYAAALTRFEDLSAAGDPRFADRAVYWIGRCHLEQGAHAAAHRALEDVVQRYPNSPLLPEMMFNDALALQAAGSGAAAVEVLEAFRSRFPGHALVPEVLRILADAAHRSHDYANSARYCAEFLQLDPGHSDDPAMAFLAAENAYLGGDSDRAQAAYRTFLSRHPADARAPAARFRLGMLLYEQGRYDEAQSGLRAVADAAEDFRAAHFALGDMAFHRQQWPEAEQAFTRYLAAGLDVPSAGDALLKLGLTHQRREQWDAALQAYGRLLEHFPGGSQGLQAHFERGQVLMALGRFEDARPEFEWTLEHTAAAPFAAHARRHLGSIAVRTGDYDAAVTHFRELGRGAADGSVAGEAAFHEAQALLASEQYPRAETALRAFLKDHPDHADAGRAAAQLAIAIGRQGRAGEALERIEDLDRGGSRLDDRELQAAVRYEKAWCLRTLQRFDEAAAVYAELFGSAHHPAVSVQAGVELTELDLAAGRHDQAAQRIAELDGRDLPAALRRRMVYQKAVCALHERRSAEAAELFERFLGDHPPAEWVCSARLLCGEALFVDGADDRAVAHLAAVGESCAPDHQASAWLRLGEVYARRQQWPESEGVFAEFRRRFASHERWFQAQFGSGWALENQGRHEAAIAAYTEVVERHRGETAARAQFQIGECLFAMHRYREAVTELLKVDILFAYAQWSAAALYEAGRCFEKLEQVAEARAQYQQVVDRYSQQQRWHQLAARRLSELGQARLPGR